MIKTTEIQKNLIYLFGFLCGMSSYITKFYSLKILIHSFTLEQYPAILLVTGLSLFVFYNFISSQLKKSEFLSNLISFLLPCLIIWCYEKYNLSFAANSMCFIGMLISTQFVDISFKTKIKSHFSLLRDSKVASFMTLVEELGILLLSLVYLMLPKFLDLNYEVYFAPLALSLFVIFALGSSNLKSKVGKTKVRDEEKSSYSFVIPAIMFFSGLMLIRQLQNFGSFLGMQELIQAGYTIGELFSYTNIIQFVLIFSIIGSKILFQKKNQAWITGVNVFLVSQAIFFLLLTFFMSPLLLIGSSVVRKVFAHTTLSESLKLLNSNFPAHIATTLQVNMNKYGSLFSYLSMAVISYIFINKAAMTIMWALAVIFSLAVFLIGKKLFSSLVEFQVSNLFNPNVYEAVNSCYGLANKHTALYSSSLSALIKQNHPPILLKAIIYTLGEMRGEGSEKSLMNAYSQFEREDIQLEIIEALAKFNDHDVDLFLLLTLEDIITTQTSLGEIRKQIFEAIISRVNVIAIPLVLGLLESKKEDERVLANVVMILGEIAVQKRDPDLYSRLFKYTDSQYPRRIISNSLIYLYPQKKYQMKSFGIISSFMISEDIFDQNAAAFLAGELGIKSVKAFVFQKAKMLDRKNSTLEIALLKLEESSSSQALANIILGEDKEASYTCLNQFNSIRNKKTRYQVYNYIIQNKAHRLSDLMNAMAQSLRNFDEDRMLLYAEAKRLGLEVESPLD